ncbi:serine hydrolase domain-containing protein [Flavobacterium ardleyense]|uniref:Serine hydrolase domain-containing protein n=1 Tax=Flavobacterium ardleyense TaxID=2038737 RepID=A0ABW5ZAH3_9FLAO
MSSKFVIIFLASINFSIAQDSFESTNVKTEKIINHFIKKENVPGMSVSISYNDTLIFSKGFGYADIENKIIVDPSTTKFRIASITKTLTAATIIKMSEQDLIDIDKSVYFYLDSLPKKQYDFTIKQVGGHVSGIKRIPSEEKISCDNIYNKKDFNRVFKNDDLLFKPLSKFSYSNYGYKLLGLLIEKVANEDITSSHKKYILNPLNLEGIIIDNGNYDENSSKFYLYKDNDFSIAPCLDCTFKYASGCYLSTSEDLVKFGNSFLFINRLLNKESLLQLITSQKLSDKKKTGYGFGFTSTKDINGNFFYGHNGGYDSSRSSMRIYPESKLVIVILINMRIDDIDNLASKISCLYINKMNK